MKNCVIGIDIRPLAIFGVLLAAVLSSPVTAQTCSGEMATATDPNTFQEPLQFTNYPDFAEVVRISLTPGAGTGSEDLTLDQVDYALACADNQDQVPCVNGNDQGASSGAVPIEYVGNVAGDCGVTDAGVTVDPVELGSGTVRFSFPEALTFAEGEGCTISFDVEVRDQGTDSTPLNLTGAARATGSCGKLPGTGRGSVSINLEDAPPPPPPLSVPSPQGWWLVFLAMVLLIPAVSRIGRVSA